MIKTIEELVDEVNGRCYTIYINALMKNFNKYKSKRELLIEIFREAYKIEFDEFNSYLALKKNIGLLGDEYDEIETVVKKLKSRLTISGLKKCHDKTGEELFVIAQHYLTVAKKNEAYENLYKQLNLKCNLDDEISIRKQLKFSINTSEKDIKKHITLEYPTFNGLNIEEIKEILGLGEHIECRNNEEILEFINKNESVFKEGFSSNYLIKGNVIYFNIYQSEVGI